MKVTLLFPGQGTQYVGMGKNLVTDPETKELFQKADKALGFSITNLMLNGPIEDLTLTQNTQPAIVAHSVALWQKLRPILAKKNITVERVLGHSVGEYSALVASGVLSFEDAICAVNKRGRYMQEAVPEGTGAMAAIIKVPKEIVIKACSEASKITHPKICMPANFNEAGQIVISGHKEAVDGAALWLKNNYPEKHSAIPLKVSAPFHSGLMMPAQLALAEYFKTLTFKNAQLCYVANIDAKEYPVGTTGDKICDNLIRQVSGSVLWEQSLSALPSSTRFIEVGPGKVLTGLNKKINSEFKTLTLDHENAFNELEEFLK